MNTESMKIAIVTHNQLQTYEISTKSMGDPDIEVRVPLSQISDEMLVCEIFNEDNNWTTREAGRAVIEILKQVDNLTVFKDEPYVYYRFVDRLMLGEKKPATNEPTNLLWEIPINILLGALYQYTPNMNYVDVDEQIEICLTRYHSKLNVKAIGKINGDFDVGVRGDQLTINDLQPGCLEHAILRELTRLHVVQLSINNASLLESLAIGYYKHESGNIIDIVNPTIRHDHIVRVPSGDIVTVLYENRLSEMYDPESLDIDFIKLLKEILLSKKLSDQ